MANEKEGKLVSFKEGLTILGKKVRTPTRKLESFAAPETITEVVLETNEWTSLCPVTGQPDFCRLKITYRPNDRCLESKSMKLYVWSFRNEAMFVEHMAQRVAKDVKQAIDPEWVVVEIEQGIRGGIGIIATAAL